MKWILQRVGEPQYKQVSIDYEPRIGSEVISVAGPDHYETARVLRKVICLDYRSQEPYGIAYLSSFTPPHFAISRWLKKFYTKDIHDELHPVLF